MQLHSMLASAAVAVRALRGDPAGQLPAASPEGERFSSGLRVLRVLAREHPQQGLGSELALILRLARHEWMEASPTELAELVSHAEARGRALGAAELGCEIAATLAMYAPEAASRCGVELERGGACHLGRSLRWLGAFREAGLAAPGLWDRGVFERVIAAGSGLGEDGWEVYRALVPDRVAEVGNGALVSREVLCELAELAEAATAV